MNKIRALKCMGLIPVLAVFIFWSQDKPRHVTAVNQNFAKALLATNQDRKTLITPVTSQYESSIQHAQDYLKQTLEQVSPSKRLILDYLQRKYELYGEFSASQTPIGYPTGGQHDDPLAYPAFRRFAYPNDLVSVLPNVSDDTMTQMMMAAANCDHIALSSSFGDLVRSNIKAGGYNLTHVAFSLQRMKENNCHYFSAEQAVSLESEVTTGMVNIAVQSDVTPDLRYESIAFLLDLDRKDLVPQHWIDQIVSEQQPEGGWKAQTDESDTDAHATILALWALLGYTRPNVPSEPMIYPPAQ